MIILAREFRGYTQKELVEKLEGVSQGHLSKLELGIHDVSEEIIKQFCTILDLPVSFFQQTKQHYGLPLSINGNFRKKQSLSKKANLKIKALINIILYNIEDIVSSSNFKPKLHDLQISYKASENESEKPKQISEEDKKSISKIVSEVKQHLDINDSQPIDNLVKILEASNILVIDVNFDTSLVDGFSYWIDDTPVIFVSRHISGDRQRFTIAHELAHLVLHKNYFNEQMEAEANYFASEFLMPKQAIKDDFNYVSLESLANLKLKWKTSMASLLMKAKDLDAVSDNLYKGLFIRMSQLGYRKTEPVTIDYESTSIMKKLISNIKEDTETEKIFHLKSEEIKEIYGV